MVVQLLLTHSWHATLRRALSWLSLTWLVIGGLTMNWASLGWDLRASARVRDARPGTWPKGQKRFQLANPTTGLEQQGAVRTHGTEYVATVLSSCCRGGYA